VTGVVPAQRCLDLLEILAEHPGGMPLTALADALGFPKSATHRILSLLVNRGYAHQEEVSGRYRLTLRLTGMGFRFLAGTKLSEIAQPILDRLAAQTGELARMAVVDKNGLTWVAKAQGAKSGLRYDPDMGRDVVLHATATGKAWLATLSPEVASSLVQARGFEVPDRFGPKVVRTLGALKKELERTRERGYGMAEEEGEPGTAAIAAVIRRHDEPDAPVVGTVSIAGPVARLTAGKREQFASYVLAAAEDLSAIWPVHLLGEYAVPPARAAE
jgi:IclR family transcriptional regulator, acetate operon repressor